ncbi:hypothetical protein CRE_04185 [Caenorhabditis remanei]|uniref:Sdz-33 F-box domain-containing protein n=1 Tax=Caenorhabditis remanei TaxID=31234 RepID=E3MYV5_CAERE|nr:hypothetical protein CRE_04185 [Caenorhabditis remanei]
MMLNAMRTIQGWEIETFTSKEEPDVFMKRLDEEVFKMLSEFDPKDPMAVRLREELHKTEGRVSNLLNDSQEAGSGFPAIFNTPEGFERVRSEHEETRLDLAVTSHTPIVEEPFNLSICSTKAKNTIKAYTKRFKYSITFYFQENFTFSLGTGPDQNIKLDVKTHKDLFKSLFSFLRVSTVTNSTVTTSISWTRFENDVKLFLVFLMDVFHNPAVSLKFKDRRDVFVTGFIEFMNSQNLKIQKLEVESKSGEDQVVEFVMDHARHNPEVHLGCLTTSRFEYPNRSLTPKLNIEILRIDHSKWVTTWHMTNLFINCKRLVLLDCTSSNLQLNLFFKKWIATPSQLKYAELQCYSPSLSLAGIMTGVPAIRLQRAVADDRVLNHASYLITQQKTGVKALVYWHRFITLTTDFEL